MKSILLFLLLVILSITLSPLAFSSEEYTPKKDPVFINGLLAANEQMLNRFENRYEDLMRLNAQNPQEANTAEITQLHYKIEALKEDHARLSGLIKEQKNAETFAANLAEQMRRVEPEKVKAPLPDLDTPLVPAPLKVLDERPTRPARKTRAPILTVFEKPKDDAETLGLMHSNALDYVSQKKYPEALDIYNEIIMLDPEDDQAYIIMGHIHMMMNDFEKAQAAFKNAVHIDPDNIHEITPFYENMILQGPNDDMAHSYLGYAYLILGQLQRAESAFLDALNLNPQNVQAQKGLEILNHSVKNAE